MAVEWSNHVALKRRRKKVNFIVTQVVGFNLDMIIAAQ